MSVLSDRGAIDMGGYTAKQAGWNFPVSDESGKTDDFERWEMSFARPQMQMPKLRVGISPQTVTYKINELPRCPKS